MKKQIWLLIAVLHLVSDLFSQNIQFQEKPDYLGRGSSAILNKALISNDKQNYRLKNSIDHAIVTLENGSKIKHKYSYNSNDKIIMDLEQGWLSNRWLDFKRKIYEYDANGNLTLDLSEKWNSNQWIGEKRLTMTYDSNRNQTSKLEERWENNQWTNYEQWTQTYDTYGNELTYLNEYWDGNNWIINLQHRHTYTYDSDGNISLDVIEDWSNIDNKWENSQRLTYTYDSNGDITSKIYEGWDLIHNKWEKALRESYTYDGERNMISKLYEDWWLTYWQEVKRWTYTYDLNGNKTSELYEYKDVNWINSWRQTFTYDFNGNLTSDLYEEWEHNQWQMKHNYKRTFSYFPNGDMKKGKFEKWDNGNWIAHRINFELHDSYENLYEYEDIIIIDIFYNSTLIREAEIGEMVEHDGQFSTVTNANEVKFTKVFDRDKLEIKAEIYEVKEDTIRFLLPCGLIFSQKLFLEKFNEGVTRDTVIYEITTNKGQPNETTITDSLIWILPQLLIYDQVVNPPVAILQQILPQYDLVAGYPIDVSSFFFLGRSEDEMVGLRVVNTIQRTTYSPPLTLDLRVSVPGLGKVPPFQRFDEGPGDKAIQFDVKYDSIYCVCVFQEKNEAVNPPGFPAPFQIHLAGNVGNPRKLINNEPEFPRGTRQDILFNHPAPRPQQLLEYHTDHSRGAETALFKFTNYASINPNVVAVLVPPRQNPEGMPLGGAYLRAPDPQNPVSITTPTAMTDALNPAFIGSIDSLVIDFTQLPYPVPADSTSINNYWNNTVAAVIGKNTKSVSLPLSNMNAIKSIICDMGSGHEIYNGSGDDFQIFVTSGSYQVAVSNTPFAGTFVSIPGTFAGTQQFDLAQTTLNSARYVRITASPSVAVEAISALNMFMDVNETNLGPMLKTDHTTMMMQRVKAFQTDINPFLQLIAQDGIMIDHNPGGFGDDTNQILTDAALTNRPLSVFGYQRFLAKGYEQRPGKEAFGIFHVRLETAGEWDAVDINVSEFNEKDTNPQKHGNFSRTRERDSYLFKAQPGQHIAMSVKALSSQLNMVLELFDPEGFLIAANDDYENRGRNSALSLYLPAISFFSDSTLPNPSTYRIVVSAIDTVAGSTVHNGITAYNRKSTGGSYELRVFKGMLEGEELSGPAVTNCSPNGAIQGANNVEVLINGSGFVDGATVSFSGSSISVQSVSFINSSQLKIKINISQSAPIQWYDVTVTNPDGGKKTVQNLFEVRSSFGMVNLNWQAPQIGEALNAPSNLTAFISGQQAMAKKLTVKQNKNKVFTKSNFYSLQRRFQIHSTAEDVIAEVEPNNDFNQAQIVQGDSSIWIDGRAETADTGPVTFEYVEGTDDVEDWFKFNSQGDYLEIILYGFTSDCDLFLFASPDSSGLVDFSINADDTTEEYLYLDPAPKGTFYVGVSIFDQLGIEDTTFYNLDIYGNFGTTSTKRLKSYNIYRSRTPNARTTGTKIASVDSNTTSFQDNPPSKRMFYYQVTAVYDQGESEPSNEASVLITKVNEDKIMPNNFVLYQNYPNPFNPETRIGYDLPRSTHVRVDIFNVLGQKIRTLVDEQKPAGAHTVVWDGRNDNGEQATTGVYIYRLKTEEFQKSRKLLLLR